MYSTDGNGPSSNKFKYQQSFLKKDDLYFNTKSTYAHAICSQLGFNLLRTPYTWPIRKGFSINRYPLKRIK
jgi:hypothetical protein